MTYKNHKQHNTTQWLVSWFKSHHFTSPAGTFSVVGNLDDLVQLLSEAFEVALVRTPFLAVGVELFLAGPPKVLQEVDVCRKGVVQGSLGTAAFL